MMPFATDTAAHAGDRVARPLNLWDEAIARTLLAVDHHIEVRVRTVGEVVHLHPQRPLTVPERVTVLRQFFEFTDSPLHFHGDVIWA